MILNTYKKYILLLFSKTLIEVILVFFSLILIINLFEEINFLREENVTGYYPIFLALLNAPSIIFDILPFIFLISTLLFFIKLINKSELSIFKYTGITNNQILRIMVLFSFIVGLFLIFGYYTFSSKLKSQYLLKKNQFTSDDKYLAVITENGLWIRDEVNGTINITNADKINNDLLINVSIIQFDKNFNLLQVIESEEVNIKSKKWNINNPFITKKNTTNKLESVNLNSNFDIEIINNLFSNLSSMSLMKLNKLKKDYKKLGYSTVGIKVYENKIFSVPVYLAIMTLLSGIIMFNSKYKKSKIFNVILGITLSVIIYYVNYFSGLLGETGKIPIILSVWLPLIILILISSIGLIRLNEK
ncbi:MAG TPA: LptF/LptG family permease [Candidatus Pelagibacter bacterium]|jgi:lipopolysaccharide export system permease protein|nr:permease [Pelagibacteraceae bacterium]HJN84156.1 LptF/LptG family permease [Candidatus Pelagibacter bacterium]|tara:strand:- start:15101 stop:16180 length:1080 start_codon:yes stop_codon:yes gene_type:complete